MDQVVEKVYSEAEQIAIRAILSCYQAQDADQYEDDAENEREDPICCPVHENFSLFLQTLHNFRGSKYLMANTIIEARMKTNG